MSCTQIGSYSLRTWEEDKSQGVPKWSVTFSHTLKEHHWQPLNLTCMHRCRLENATFFLKLFYLLGLQKISKKSEISPWINRDLVFVPYRKICLEKLFFSFSLMHFLERFWKKNPLTPVSIAIVKVVLSLLPPRKWLLKKRFQIHWSQFGSLPIWSKYSNRELLLAPALFGIFPRGCCVAEMGTQGSG